VSVDNKRRNSVIEIERKFLLKNDSWKKEIANKTSILQGYFLGGKNGLARIRTTDDDVYITFKGHGSEDGTTRTEVECTTTLSEAELEAVLSMCDGTLRKIRYFIPHHEEQGLMWEIDVFLEENAGLVVAEIELDFAERAFDLPDWIGDDVTQDPKYLNSNLLRSPFTTW